MTNPIKAVRSFVRFLKFWIGIGNAIVLVACAGNTATDGRDLGAAGSAGAVSQVGCLPNSMHTAEVCVRGPLPEGGAGGAQSVPGGSGGSAGSEVAPAGGSAGEANGDGLAGACCASDSDCASGHCATTVNGCVNVNGNGLKGERHACL